MGSGKTPKQIIAEYREAYRAANGRDVTVGYSRGWYTIGSQTGRRKEAIIEMTDNLRARAREEQSGTPMIDVDRVDT